MHLPNRGRTRAVEVEVRPPRTYIQAVACRPPAEENRSPGGVPSTDTVTRIVAELREGLEELYGPRLERMVPFGSQARGDAARLHALNQGGCQATLDGCARARRAAAREFVPIHRRHVR